MASRSITVLPAVLTALAVAASGIGPAPATAQEIEDSQAATFEITTVARGLDSPWGLAELPDGRFIVTEKAGQVRIIGTDGAVSEPLEGVGTITQRGQGGLLDVALHPDFAENGYVYFTYVAGSRRVSTRLSRAKLVDNTLEGWRELFAMEPASDGGRHFGSRIAFAPDGTIYVSFGDRGRRDEAQDPGNHIGTVIRLEDNGSLPPDNPFIDSTSEKAEIFSYGHRNVQGMAVHPRTGAVWTHEHGPRGGDEVNILKIGANYGWPAITYGEEYSGGAVSPHTALPGMEQPLLYWVPSIAPSGMAFYDGEAFPGWQGDLFVGALRGRHLRRIDLDGDAEVGHEELLKGLRERIRDVHMGSDGFLYVLTDGGDARLLRLSPAGG